MMGLVKVCKKEETIKAQLNVLSMREVRGVGNSGLVMHVSFLQKAEPSNLESTFRYEDHDGIPDQ